MTTSAGSADAAGLDHLHATPDAISAIENQLIEHYGWIVTDVEPGCKVATFGDNDEPEFAITLWTGEFSPGAITIQLHVNDVISEEALADYLLLANEWNTIAQFSSACLMTDTAEDPPALVVRATVPITPTCSTEHALGSLELVITELVADREWRAGVEQVGQRD